jgi:hypothetical protein
MYLESAWDFAFQGECWRSEEKYVRKGISKSTGALWWIRHATYRCASTYFQRLSTFVFLLENRVEDMVSAQDVVRKTSGFVQKLNAAPGVFIRAPVSGNLFTQFRFPNSRILSKSLRASMQAVLKGDGCFCRGVSFKNWLHRLLSIILV